MRLFGTLFTVWIVLGHWSCVAPVVGAEAKHLVEAKALVAKLNLQNTSYEHGKGSIQWDAPCESHTDCSGFVDALLTHAYGFSDSDLKHWFSVKRRPRAEDYHAVIVKQHGFQHIPHVQDAHPGDFLAVEYREPDAKNTGHIMLVVDRPRRINPSKPLVAGTEQWEVTIIDSSSSGHGPSDTRSLGQGKSHAGLGQGILRLYTDSAGAVLGYSWSTLGGSAFKDQNLHHLVIGRLDPHFKPQ